MSNQSNCVACDESPGMISMQGSVLVSKMYHEVTGLKVKSFYTICKSCQQELRSCYNFRKRCLEIFALYDSPDASTSNAQESSSIFANPLASEVTIVKSENDKSNSAVTFQDKEEDSMTFEDFNNQDDDDMDDNGNEDEIDATVQYDDMNPPMSDDEDSNEAEEGDETTPRFECDECSKVFSKRSRLVGHKAEHRNERLYTCPRAGCNSAFNVPHRLTRHLRKVHEADETEINECTFALVEDSSGVYVVRNNWLFYKDGAPHIFYPPPTAQNPSNFVKHTLKPGDDWVQYPVKILRQKIPSYESIKTLQDIRLCKRSIRGEFGPVAKKLKTLQTLESSQSPHSSNFMPSFFSNNRNSLNNKQGFNSSQVSLTAAQNEKMRMMESNFNTQLRDLKMKLNCLMHMVQGRGGAGGSIQATLEDDQFSPKALSCEKDFIEMEENLIAHDRNPMISSEFSIKRERMIEHYACKLKNINKRTNPKIGLVGSLLNLYFAPEFLKTIGWTNAQGRLAVKDMVGHISLFYEIVNRNTPGTYMNMEEASTGLYTFLRRFHENKNAKHRVKDNNQLEMYRMQYDGSQSEQMYMPPMHFIPKIEIGADYPENQVYQPEQSIVTDNSSN